MFTVIRERLATRKPLTIDCEPSIRAATAILLFEHDNDVLCVLTRRTDTVRHHRGEVSFPGGMFETGDRDLEHTALREANEEIGVRPGDVEVIGRLDDSRTLTGFVISPFVGIIPHPYKFSTNPQEVAYLIFLPCSHLEKAGPVMERTEHEGRVWMVPTINYGGDRIWGATCRILLQLRDIVENEEI